jgi:hypothetical protein
LKVILIIAPNYQGYDKKIFEILKFKNIIFYISFLIFGTLINIIGKNGGDIFKLADNLIAIWPAV